MQIISPNDGHTDARRVLTAWQNLGLQTEEVKIINVTAEQEIPLGNHSHDYPEPFVIPAGVFTLTTWSEKEGLKTVELQGPVVLIIESGEEHVFKCGKGTIIIGLLPQNFKEENTTKATHLF